jgi:sec-independent protein translocase protein TatC
MSQTDDLEGSAAPLIEHLKELRNRILISMGAFVVAFIIAFMLVGPIWGFISNPICDAMAARGDGCNLQVLGPQDSFFVAMKLAMWGGFVIAFPIITFQMWRFVAPGLYRNEKRAFLPFLIASPVMFLIGGAFAYLVVIPYAFTFFLNFQDQLAASMKAGADTALTAMPKGLVFQGSIDKMYSLVMQFLLAFGLCFQLPVLLTLMGKAGLIGSKALKATRKYAVVGILVLSSMIAPPDVTSMMILFAAIYPLYEVSIWIIVMFERQAEAKAKADGTWEPEDEE